MVEEEQTRRSNESRKAKKRGWEEVRKRMRKGNERMGSGGRLGEELRG